MSSGAFVDVRYRFRNDDGSYTATCLIRVQPETLELRLNGRLNTESPAVGAPNTYLFLTGPVRRRGALGLVPRCVIIEWTTPPPGYVVNNRLWIPVPFRGNWNQYQPGRTGTYLGYPCVSVERRGEIQGGQEVE